jgi:hypothetical protein
MLNLTALITLTSLIDLVRFSILFVALDVIRPVCPQPLRQELRSDARTALRALARRDITVTIGIDNVSAISR